MYTYADYYSGKKAYSPPGSLMSQVPMRPMTPWHTMNFALPNANTGGVQPAMPYDPYSFLNNRNQGGGAGGYMMTHGGYRPRPGLAMQQRRRPVRPMVQNPLLPDIGNNPYPKYGFSYGARR